MSLLDHLIVLNLLELDRAIPQVEVAQREKVYYIALNELQAVLREANDQLIELKMKHVRLETHMVELMRNIQNLQKSDATATRDKQLNALQEAKSRLQEELNGLEYDERGLRQEVSKLEAKVKTAQSQQNDWLKNTSNNTAYSNTTSNANQTESSTNASSNQNATGNSSASSTSSSATVNSSQNAADGANNAAQSNGNTTPKSDTPDFQRWSSVSEPFERLERLKRKLAANEISTAEASRVLEQEMRNAELERLFQAEEEREELAKQLAELKKKLQ